ncbi:MAG: hypothetical protein KGR26_05900, partial [Cyanobacteria bacterium REEB65]|nr:hypothetical protein [Cyanobacteria bacterium REEB65]
LLFDPTHPAAIAATIRRLLADPALARDLATKGRRRIEGFDAPGYRSALRDLVSETFDAHLSARDRAAR